MEPYSLIKSTETYRGGIFSVMRDTISLPDGRTAEREVVIRGDASVIVPIDADGNIVFVRQYRHPAKSMELELPAGMMNEGETPEVCAARELEEETGMTAGCIRFITKMYPSIGFCTEVLHIYLAEQLRQGAQHLDEDEFVDVERYTPEEAVSMIFNGKIKDGKTMVGVLAYSHLQF